MAADPADELALRYRRLAWKVARKHAHWLSPGADEDDLAQVCWMAVRRAADRWDAGRASFKSYAWAAATNAARRFVLVDRRRGMTRLGDVYAVHHKLPYVPPVVHGEGDLPGEVTLAEAARDRTETGERPEARLARVVAALGRLTPRQREFVGLILGGSSQAAAAAALGISRGRAWKLMGIARRRLAEVL